MMRGALRDILSQPIGEIVTLTTIDYITVTMVTVCFDIFYFYTVKLV